MRRSEEMALRRGLPICAWFLAAFLVLLTLLGGCRSQSSEGAVAGHYVREGSPDTYLILNADHTFRFWGPSVTVGGKEAIGEWTYDGGKVVLTEYFRYLNGELSLKNSPMGTLEYRKGELRGASYHLREFTWVKR